LALWSLARNLTCYWRAAHQQANHPALHTYNHKYITCFGAELADSFLNSWPHLDLDLVLTWTELSRAEFIPSKLLSIRPSSKQASKLAKWSSQSVHPEQSKAKQSKQQEHPSILRGLIILTYYKVWQSEIGIWLEKTATTWTWVRAN